MYLTLKVTKKVTINKLKKIYFVSLFVTFLCIVLDEELADKLKRWKEEHFLGWYDIPVERLSPPKDDIESRPLDLAWVTELQESFRRFRSVNADIIVLLRTERIPNFQYPA